jgi:hypothetical protein
MTPTPESTAPLLPEWAFVVQFRDGTDLEHGQALGRVEHIVSGEATRFHSLEELTVFFTRVLLTVQRSSSAQPSSRGSAR